MNLEESDSFREELEKTSKKKKFIIVSIALCGLLLIFLVALIIAIQRKDATTEKFFLDDVQISNPKNVYTEVNGTIYVNVLEFVELLKTSKTATIKYDCQKGHYGLYDEDETSCLIDNGYETVEVSADNKYYTKYIDKSAPDEPVISNIEVSIKSDYGYSEKFVIEKPIIYMNEIIYVPLENIPEMFNVRINWGEYRKKIYSFESVLTATQQSVKKYAADKTMSGYYENLKAALYGYVVLGNADESYGVYSLTDGSDRLSTKYKDITFVQNAQEFYITADNGTMGLVSADGNTIIKTSEYENISLLDDDNKLYIVEKDDEYGVINRTGKTVIYTEYDGIGYDTSKFSLDTIKNEKLLAEKCIPVEKNGKFGLFNLEGEQILNTSYDGLGYISASESRKAGEEESILMIPKTEGVNGIIVNQGDLYGIFDLDEENLFLPCSFSKIFAIRKSGKIIYYIEFNGQQYELKEYLETLGIAKKYDMLEKDEEKQESESDSLSNTISETNTPTNETIEVAL